MPSALIIGASRGIGREFVRQLLQDGWKVYATARSEPALTELRAIGAEALKIDVAIPESLAALSWPLDGVKLDLAVYVAGVIGPDKNARDFPTMSEFDAVMHTNVLGAMQAIPLVAPLVEEAGGKFAFISSGMGSVAETSGSTWIAYRASKAALNMVVKAAAGAYQKATLVALSPGWVRTDMGGAAANLSVEESVAGMRRALSALKRTDSGGFVNYDGRRVPW